MNGLCQCGCGQKTNLAPITCTKRGDVAGQPLRFIFGHQMRGRKNTAESNAKRSTAMKRLGIRPPTGRPFVAGVDQGHGPTHRSWKGGVATFGGRRAIHKPDHPRAMKCGYVYEYILVAEAKLGRVIERGEVVHHIDENPNNNSPENLMVFPSQGAHSRHHCELRRLKRAKTA